MLRCNLGLRLGLRLRWWCVSANDIADKNLDPAVSLLVALCAKYVSNIRSAGTFLRLDDEERVSVRVVVVWILRRARFVLTTNLSTCNRNRTEVVSSALYINSSIFYLELSRIDAAHAFVVLKGWTLKHEIPSLPARSTTFRQEGTVRRLEILTRQSSSLSW